MDLGLAGRAALVTGGSRGIGLAVARALTAEGFVDSHLYGTRISNRRSAVKPVTGQSAGGSSTEPAT